MPLAVRHETGFAEFRISSRMADDERRVAKNQVRGLHNEIPLGFSTPHDLGRPLDWIHTALVQGLPS